MFLYVTGLIQQMCLLFDKTHIILGIFNRKDICYSICFRSISPCNLEVIFAEIIFFCGRKEKVSDHEFHK